MPCTCDPEIEGRRVWCRWSGWRITKVSPLWVAYSGPAVAGEIFADPRRLFGGSAALEERDRLHTKLNDEDLPVISRKLPST